MLDWPSTLRGKLGSCFDIHDCVQNNVGYHSSRSSKKKETVSEIHFICLKTNYVLFMLQF